MTNTEHDAGIESRLSLHPVDDRDHDEPSDSAAPEHAHGPGLLCLVCALDEALAKSRTDDEHLVCEACTALYDSASEGCAHGQILCAQCLGRCTECCYEMREQSKAEAAMDRWRER